jgi:hypothetical protein
MGQQEHIDTHIVSHELHLCLLQIFFWLNVPAAEMITVQYSTWFPYSTGHVKVLLLRFSLL